MDIKRHLGSIVLFGISLLVHLPFLFAGYGREEDAWSLVMVAREIWNTKVYEVSRLPGHPVQELLLAALWPVNHSYFFFNLLSAIATSMAVVFFFKCAQRLLIKNPFWLAIAFAFVPVIFIAGTYTIDYNFGLLFILLSFYYFLKNKAIFSGTWLGVATGFRISSLAFLLPFALFSPKNFYFKKLGLMVLFAIGVSLFAFIPALFTYGTAFLDFHKPPFPGWANIIYKISFGIWGVPLLIAIVWFLGQNVKGPHPRTYAFLSSKNLLFLALWAWALQALIFARLPFKSEFFIPAIPFLFFYLGRMLTKKDIQVLAICAIFSTFTMGFDYLDPFRGSLPSPVSIRFRAGGKTVYFDLLKGPVIHDLQKRKTKARLIEEIGKWQSRQDSPALVIAGWYWPQIVLQDFNNPNVRFVYYSGKSDLKEAAAKSLKIYYLPEINEANAKIKGHYLADSLGTELPVRP